jgi:cation:H+ antiporter
MLAAELLRFLFAGIILVVSSNFLVKSLTKLSRFLKLNEFALSFILMAFATSLPELVGGITSSFEGNSSLSFGLAVGSNIANLSLILGVVILLARRIPVSGILKRKDAVNMSIIAIFILLLSGDGQVSRADGLILLIIYGFYIVNLFTNGKYHKRNNTDTNIKEILIYFLMFMACLVGLLISAELLVEASTELANILSVPLLLIGFILVAFGTSLPELAFEIRAIGKNHKDLALGDIIGSVVTNSTLVIGISAVISPITLHSMNLLRTSFIFLILVVVIFNLFMYTKKELSRWEGAVLIGIYLLYISSEFFVQVAW